MAFIIFSRQGILTKQDRRLLPMTFRIYIQLRDEIKYLLIQISTVKKSTTDYVMKKQLTYAAYIRFQKYHMRVHAHIWRM